MREHAKIYKSELSIKDFSILGTYNNDTTLLIAESLFLKLKPCKLNNDASSIPLSIAETVLWSLVICTL